MYYYLHNEDDFNELYPLRFTHSDGGCCSMSEEIEGVEDIVKFLEREVEARYLKIARINLDIRRIKELKPITLNNETILEYINDLIAERTSYGTRTVDVLPEKYTIITWSNGSASWYINNSSRHNHNDEVMLDANEVVVALYKDNVRSVIEELDDLPLYENSFEYQNKPLNI